jgi:potassium efflux system protein
LFGLDLKVLKTAGTSNPPHQGKYRFVSNFNHYLRCLAIIVALFVAAPFFTESAGAQSIGQVGPSAGIIAEQQQIIDGLNKRTDDFERKVEASRNDDIALVDIRLQLEDIARQLLKSGLAFRPRIADINARIAQLGPPPAEGQPAEPDIVSSERQALVAEKAEINTVLGSAENLSLRVNGLIDHISELRRELFAHVLTKRYIINYALFGQVADDFYSEGTELLRTVTAWVRFVVQFKFRSVLIATFLALVAAAVLLIGGRRLFGRLIDADPAIEKPSYLSRLSVAFWSTLLPTAAVTGFLATTYFLYDYFSVLRPDIATMMTTLFIVLGVVFFVQRLAKAVLSPKLPNWRLIPVETKAARLLLWLVFATVAFTGIDVFLSSVYQVLGSPLTLTVVESLVATVLTGIPVILMGLIKPFADEEGRPQPWHPLLRAALYLLGGLTIVTALLGYIGFARFLSMQLVFTGAILSTMYIGFLSARAVSEEDAFGRTAVGRRLEHSFKLDPTTLDQLALVVGIAINLLIAVIGLPLILFMWGFQPGDIQAWFYKLATGVRIGSVTISLTGILTGILVFILVYFVSRWFSGWLDGSVLARGRVDVGVRNSIRTAVGYAGILLAALLGVSSAGIDMSNIALVAGALSLGIGFGLQNIVSNFVSGLILLAERPFKVGDWVVAGTNSGMVKKISVRATEIETFQRQTVIVPNSEFINAAVGNWTHRNKLGRIDVKISVAYGTDARRAAEVMDAVARSHPLVLKNPEPFVVFLNFGPAALEFELRFFLADILNANVVQNDIRFAILETFERERIEIPSTPRAVDPRFAEQPAAVAPAAEETPAAETKPVDEIAAAKARRRRVDPE